MKTGEMLDLLTNHAKKYRLDANASMSRNSHMNEGARKGKPELPQKTIDALLVDFINYVGAQHCVDYGLYTKDLLEE